MFTAAGCISAAGILGGCANPQKEGTAALEEGILGCGQIIAGFDRGDAVLCGVESRTSSPVRILRGDTMESAVQGLYPCGEGAGYAGGITSAAMDGVKTAEAIASKYRRLSKQEES